MMNGNANLCGFTVSDVSRISKNRIRVTGTVGDTTIYRTDALQSSSTGICARVQTIRKDKKRIDTALPGETVTLTLPGLKKRGISPGEILVRNEAQLSDNRSETKRYDVDLALLVKARRSCLRLSFQKHFLIPLVLLMIFLAVLLGVFAFSVLVQMPIYEKMTFRIILFSLDILVAVFVGIMGILFCDRFLKHSAEKHSTFGKKPLELTSDSLILTYSQGTSEIKSEINCCDIDSIEYYPRYDCINIYAPVYLTKFRNERIVGTKVEETPEKAFQTVFLVFVDNDGFLRDLSERSGVPIETVSSERPSIDGASF